MIHPELATRTTRRYKRVGIGPMIRRRNFECLVVIGLFFAPFIFAGPPQISQDRDLLELDLTKWDCLNKTQGTGKTPDGQERNRLKNRSAPDLSPMKVKSFDVPGFLKNLGDFDAMTKGKRRKDLVPAERQKLAPLENEIIQLTGYLGLAYAGPPESTNCGAIDFHDWHLEIVEKPPEHAPQVGDSTAVICEITPRTQNAIYRDGVKIQSLAGFFRQWNLEYESTGHEAVKVRITGYLLWDDEHNGSADVGTSISRIAANKYHNPWRKTAWEIHPVLKIEPIGPVAVNIKPPNERPPATVADPSATEPPSATPTPTPTPTPVPPPATPTRMQSVTLVQPITIKIPYGQAVLPRGTRLKVLSHDAQTVKVDYLGGTYPVPISSTDWH